MKHVDIDPLGRPVPCDEIGHQMMARMRLALMSRVAARKGDQDTALDLTEQMEQMGYIQFARGQEELGIQTLTMSLFYEELNGLTLSGTATSENIAALYQSYGLEPPNVFV